MYRYTIGMLVRIPTYFRFDPDLLYFVFSYFVLVVFVLQRNIPPICWANEKIDDISIYR